MSKEEKLSNIHYYKARNIIVTTALGENNFYKLVRIPVMILKYV